MANLSYAYCLSCTKEARGRERVESVFGLRNNGGHIMVQSHCKECRSRENNLRRQSGLIKHRTKKL